MVVVLGHSEELDSTDAIAEVLQQCTASLNGQVPQAGLLYAGIDHDFQVLLDGIEDQFPGIQLIGCTTHGEISSAGFAEDSVVLMVLHGEQVQCRAGVGQGARTDPKGAAQRAVEAALDGLTAPVRLCLTHPEGLGIDADALLSTLCATLGPDVPVCGGMAGDQVRFEQTYQFCNGAVYTDAVPVLCLAGPLDVSTGVQSGWVPLGKSYRVTRVKGAVVSEIEGEPPRDFWMRYLGSFDLTGTRSFFAVYPGGTSVNDPTASEETRDYYPCAPSHFQEDGSMVTLNPVLPGSHIRFADATRDQVLAGAGASMAHARTTYPGTAPDVALVFSCAGRHALLGTRVGLESSQLREHIGAEVPTIGFYTYGEICPLPASPEPVTHGGTFVTVLIGERE